MNDVPRINVVYNIKPQPTNYFYEPLAGAWTKEIDSFRNANKDTPNWSDKSIGEKTVTVLTGFCKRAIAEVAYAVMIPIGAIETVAKLALTVISLIYLIPQMFLFNTKFFETHFWNLLFASLESLFETTFVSAYNLVVNPFMKNI